MAVMPVQCPNCGYDLRAQVKERGRFRCPECGNETTLAELKREKKGASVFRYIGWIVACFPSVMMMEYLYRVEYYHPAEPWPNAYLYGTLLLVVALLGWLFAFGLIVVNYQTRGKGTSRSERMSAACLLAIRLALVNLLITVMAVPFLPVYHY